MMGPARNAALESDDLFSITGVGRPPTDGRLSVQDLRATAAAARQQLSRQGVGTECVSPDDRCAACDNPMECVVARKGKHPGRRFHRCRSGCSSFATWCDEAPSSSGEERTRGGERAAVAPARTCVCGKTECAMCGHVLGEPKEVKSDKNGNKGRWFHSCSACTKFNGWCEEPSRNGAPCPPRSRQTAPRGGGGRGRSLRGRGNGSLGRWYEEEDEERRSSPRRRRSRSPPPSKRRSRSPAKKPRDRSESPTTSRRRYSTRHSEKEDRELEDFTRAPEPSSKSDEWSLLD